MESLTIFPLIFVDFAVNSDAFFASWKWLSGCLSIFFSISRNLGLISMQLLFIQDTLLTIICINDLLARLW